MAILAAVGYDRVVSISGVLPIGLAIMTLFAGAAAAEPKAKTVKTSMFDEIAIDDGAIHLADGGIHGVQGHTLVVPASGAAKWERRLDSMRPSGKAASGTLKLSADEAKQLRAWADKLWDLAPNGTASFDTDLKDGPPRWVWVIVLRRGEQVRVLSGGNIAPPKGAPEPAKATLEWLIQRVDAAAK